MNIYVESYGCSASQNDAEIMKGILAKAGFVIVNNEKLADIVILNTCIVKEPTVKSIEARIKHFAAKKLIVAGCMPEAFAARIRLLAPGASLLGTHRANEILNAVRKMAEGKKVELVGNKTAKKLCLPQIPENKVIKITQLSQGCVNKCAYCIVRSVKGMLVSYPQELILKDIKKAVDAGAKEIWLTSQDNAAYGLEKGKHALPELLDKICGIKGKFLVRLGMLNPSSIMPICDEMIECYKNEKMFKFLHIPIQSGSDNILKSMNRKYKAKDFSSIIEKFRKKIPDMTIATDIIVGFPGETESDFQATIALMKKIRPAVMNISKFWPMPNTPAAKMPKQIDLAKSKKRASELAELHRKMTFEMNSKLIGKTFKVLVDEKSFGGSLTARTPNYRPVVLMNAPISLLGKMIDVKIEKAMNFYLVGKII